MPRRAKAANPIEHVSADGHVGRDQAAAIVGVDRLFLPVIKQRERGPVVLVQPARRRRWPPRQNSAADAAMIRFGLECFPDLRDPIAFNGDVIVGERNDRRLRYRYPGIAAVRDALPRLEYIPEASIPPRQLPRSVSPG